MVTVAINGTEATLQEALQGNWIPEQIQRRRKAGETVCVRVTIHENSANMIVATATCKSSNGSGRAPNELERRIFDLWDRLHLDEIEFAPGEVEAFLRQLQRLL